MTLAFENELKVRVLEDIDPEKAKNVLIGISRIWVERSFQRKGIATRMVRATHTFHCFGEYLCHGWDVSVGLVHLEVCLPNVEEIFEKLVT